MTVYLLFYVYTIAFYCLRTMLPKFGISCVLFYLDLVFSLASSCISAEDCALLEWACALFSSIITYAYLNTV